MQCYMGNQRELLYNVPTMIATEHYIRRVSRGGGPGARAPPLEIEKQKKKKKKKKKKKVIRANIKIFCYFFSRKYHFLS